VEACSEFRQSSRDLRRTCSDGNVLLEGSL
jgi:hypothetical protein